MNHLKNIYTIQKHLKQVEIVAFTSRMVKDCDWEEKGGMVEVPMRFIKELDRMLGELDKLDSSIANAELNP
jgi:hypothetical protein